MSTTPYLGSRISLISKNDVRYEGILYGIDAQASEVYLQNVQCFGTEDRNSENPIPPVAEAYNYIIFRGSDIKDLHVCEPPTPSPEEQMANQFAGYQQQQQQQQQQQAGWGAPPGYPYNPAYGQYNPYAGYGYQQPGQPMPQQGYDPNMQQQQQVPPQVAQEAPPQQDQQQQQQQQQPVEEEQQQPVEQQQPEKEQQPKKAWNTVPTVDSGSSSDHLRNQPSAAETRQKQQGGQKGQNRTNDQQQGGRKRRNRNKNNNNKSNSGVNQETKSNQSRDRPGQYAATETPTSFTEEFDFQTAQQKFEEMRLNGPSSDDGEEYLLEETGTYDKSSFFDTISCETLDRQQQRERNARPSYQEQRKLDSETFGADTVEKNRNKNRRRNYRKNRGGNSYKNNNFRTGNQGGSQGKPSS